MGSIDGEIVYCNLKTDLSRSRFVRGLCHLSRIHSMIEISERIFSFADDEKCLVWTKVFEKQTEETIPQN